MKTWYFAEEEYQEALIKQKEVTYKKAMELSSHTENIQNQNEAADLFRNIKTYKDSREWIKKCDQKIEEILAEEKYQKAIDLIKEEKLYSLNTAIQILKEICGYKDADKICSDAQEKLTKLEQLQKDEYEKRVAENKAKQRKKAITIASVCAGLIILIIIIWAALPGCMIHDYTQLTCTQAQECKKCGKIKSEALGHKYSDATCKNLQTCVRCGDTTGKYAEHIWQKATCTEPKKCKECGKTEGKKLGHNWKAETYSTPKMCTRCKEMKAKSTPANGQVIISTKISRVCKLTINNQTQNCFVKFKDSNNNDIFGFFVKGGSAVTVDVPSGDYYVYFAYGEKWYGQKFLFGDDTECSMDSSIHSFEYNVYYDGGYKNIESSDDTYTLYTVSNGNFSPTKIDMEDF